MTDPNVRNVLFDPRCGWVLVSGGVYLGTSRVLTRGQAMVQLSAREKALGLRESSPVRSQGQRDGFESLKAVWEADARRYQAYRKIRKQS